MAYMRKFETGLHITAICLLCLSVPAKAADEYYTWVDENGITNYSERSPAGYDAEFITEETRFGYRPDPRPVETASVTAPTASAEPEETSGGDDIDPDQLIAEQKAQYEAELAAERSKNCNLAKQNLARLETYARIRVKGDDGKMRYLTESEMDVKRQESREAIKFHCR